MSKSAQLPPSRRTALVVALWLFGLSTTVLLVGIWGRSVVTNNEAIEAGARAALEAEVVADRITGWIGDGISNAAGDLPDESAAAAATALWNRPETREVLNATVDRFVAAALAPPGSSTPIDIAAELRPLSSLVIAELRARGVELTESAVDAAFAEVPTIVLGTDPESGVAGVVSEARTLLTKVVVVGLFGMLVSGGLAVAVAEERLRQIRSLAVRVAVSALTFAVVLRIGAWALDPQAGRSPLAAGGSVLLSSSLRVLFVAVLVAGGVAAAATIAVRRRRRVPAT
jgi:hypothetical protein